MVQILMATILLYTFYNLSYILNILNFCSSQICLSITITILMALQTLNGRLTTSQNTMPRYLYELITHEMLIILL
jgi:hypothetical protein